MNRPFRPVSKTSSALSAIASVLATVIVLGSVAGLAEHYSAAAQIAAAASTQRA